MENSFLWREPEKSLSSSEWIGFHSVATVWFSFPWLFWLLRKKTFQHGWQFCRLHVFKCDWKFFSPSSTLKLDVNSWSTDFIVSNHSVLNLYFIKWLGLNLRRTTFDLLVTFFTFKDIDGMFWWLFCTFRNSTCHQLFNVTIARLSNTSFGFLLC